MRENKSHEELISSVAKKLDALKSNPNKDQLVPILKEAANGLSELEQLEALKEVIRPLSKSLVKRGLLHHKDKQIQLLVSICFCEILRILAPNPDFSHSLFQDMFKLFVSLFLELVDMESCFFARRLKVLETVAKLRFCLLMLDTNAEDLILKMFNTFFTVVRENHPHGLFTAMSSIMVHVLKEKVLQSAVNMILHYLLKEKKGASPATTRLALSVIEDCTAELEHPICDFLTSCIVDRDAVQGELKEYYHEIIFEIFQCSPQILLTVIPNLSQELLAEQVDIRIKAIDLVARLLVLPGHHVAQEYRHLCVEFLRRFSDKSADVRIAAIKCVKAFYIANPHGAVTLELLTALEGRMLDFDDRVRTQAVVTVCDLARANLKSLSPELLSRAMERLQDKKVPVRKKAMQKLLEVYQDYCAKCSAGILSPSDNFEQIPCRILMLCYNKDCTEFRPQNMELVLAEELFPTSLSMEERTSHWILLFSLFNPAHTKAFNAILSQKQRFQIEMKVYLALRNSKEDATKEEFAHKIQTSVAKMSALFPDPRKAEENFIKLNSFEDGIIYSTLTQLLDEVSIGTAQITRDKFLKKLGKKHPHFEFLQLLSKKCLFNIFSSEHVHCIMDGLLLSNGDNTENSSVKLFLAIISSFPLLLRGLEKQFQLLLSEDKIPVNEQLLRMLAHAGPYIHIKFSDIYPLLERICTDGTRTLSKLAVSAIAALASASEQLVFTRLSKTLVDALHSGGNVPSILQSLGCISQYSVSSFESRAGDIYEFIFEEIFQATDVQLSNYMDSYKETCHDSSSKWKLQILALKMLVRSFLPHKSTTFGRDIGQLFDVLSQMLQNGYISDGSILCESDKAIIRLAAAKSVLRLSRKWDLHIPPQLFHITILMAQDCSSFVRRHFIDKIHRLLKHHALPNKYACAFALTASDSLKDIQDDSLKYMEDFVRGCRREAKIGQTSKNLSVTDCPAYIVVFLIHVLAHDTCFPSASCEDEKIWVQFFSPLVRVLEALVSLSDGDKNLITSSVSWLHLLFRAIKRAEDAVDIDTTPKLYMLADMGLAILNALTCNANSASPMIGPILLPSSLYRINPTEKREEACINSSSRYPLNANITKKVISGITSCISQSNAVAKPSQKVQDHTQSDIIRCSTKKLGLSKSDDMSMNVEKQIQCSNAPGQEMHANMKLDINTTRREKRVLSPSLTGSGGLHNEFSITDEAEHVASVDPESLTGTEIVEKGVLSASPPRPGGLHNEFSIDDDSETNTFVNSEPPTGKELVLSSCGSDVNSSDSLIVNGLVTDSSNIGPVPSKSARVARLSKLKDVGNYNQVLVGQQIRLWSPVDKCYHSVTVVGDGPRKDTHKITYENGEAEVVRLSSERWEIISSDSQLETDLHGFSSQHCDPVSTQSQMDNSSPDHVCQQKSKATKGENIISKKRITPPGKENNGHKAGVDTLASEIVNAHEQPIVRRTRRRK